MRSSHLLLPLVCLAAASGSLLAQETADRALQCNGRTDYLATTSLLATTNDFTVEAWINPLDPHQIDQESTSGMGGLEGQHYVIYPAHGLHSWSQGHAGVGISAGTNGVSVYEHAADHIPATLVYEGEIRGWTHIAVVYRDRQPSLYINGTLVRTGLKSTQQFVHPCAGENAKPGRNLGGIGGGYYGYFHGAIDNVRIWDEPLSGKEIGAMMQKNPGAAPHLVLSYDMNREGQGAGLALKDRTGQAAQNAATFGTSSTPVFALHESTPLAAVPAFTSGSGIAEDATASAARQAAIGDDQVAAGNGARKQDAGMSAETAGARLGDARPNPFSERTTIAYSIPSAGAVRIELFDAAGRRIGTPVDEEQSAGAHEVVVDGSAFGASGTYLYTMTWNGTTITKTIRVVR